jgi:hypothetical protein
MSLILIKEGRDQLIYSRTQQVIIKEDETKKYPKIGCLSDGGNFIRQM